MLSKKHFNKQFVLDLIRHDRFPQGYVDVQFDDGIINMPIQVAMLQIPAWELLLSQNLPVLKRHNFLELGPISKDTIYNKILTPIYQEVVETYKDKKVVDKLKDHILDYVNFMDNFGCSELNEYHSSLDLMGLSKIMEHPSVRELVDPVSDIDESLGTMQTETTLHKLTDRLIYTLSSRDILDENILLPYMDGKLLNKNQIPQVFLSYGMRTEVNDKIIPKLIKNSSLSGVKGEAELFIEFQGARKAAYYAKTAIRISQYTNRVIQILCSIIGTLYPGDCGTKVYTSLKVTPQNKDSLIGKYIYEDDGTETILLNNNVSNYMDNVVKLRGPLSCSHTDGVCEKCYGLLHLNILNGMNIGMHSAVEFISIVSQLILSTKHFIKTNTKVYVLPEEAKLYLRKTAKGVSPIPSIYELNKPIKFGVLISDLRGSLSDLLTVKDHLGIPEERYSRFEIVFMMIGDERVDIPVMVDSQCPFLTKEFLFYIRDNYSSLEYDKNIVWVPLNEDMKSTPVLRTAINNDSMMSFVNNVTKFLMHGGISKYTNANEALSFFSEAVLSKVDKVPMVHFEIVLKAHLITNEIDKSIPVVKDLSNVRFAATPICIDGRSSSGVFAYQGLKKHVANPLTYALPRENGTYDKYFGI